MQRITTTSVSSNIFFDKKFVSSNAGLIRLVVIILNLAAFIVSQFAPPYSRVLFFGFIAMTAFWISLTLYGLYAFHVVEKLYYVPWLLGEFAFSLIFTLLFAVISLLLLISGGVQIVAAIFGFVSGSIYAYETKNNYDRYSRGEIAQGERTTTPPTMA